MAISPRTLIERIDRFLRAIENGSGQPDHWEGHRTLQALAAVHQGEVERAEANLTLARTPPGLREAPHAPDVPPERRPPTTAELRLELERIKSQLLTG